MYTINEITALFRRSLKENGEYHMLSRTDCIDELKRVFDFNDPWMSFDVLTPRITFPKNKVGNLYSVRGYRLGNFYQFLYTVHDNWLLKLMTDEFETFLRDTGMLTIFINDFNLMLRKPDFAISSIFHVDKTTTEYIDKISQYIRAKLNTCPYELVRNAFPWDETNTGTAGYAKLHTEWVKHVKKLQEKKQKE